MITKENLKPVTPMDMQSMYGTVPDQKTVEDTLKEVNPELTEFMKKLFPEMMLGKIDHRLGMDAYWPWDL